MKQHYDTDAQALWSHMKHQEKEINEKRRLLIGFSPANFEKKPRFEKQALLPESVLREDDVFYEDVKIYVEKCFGVCYTETGMAMIHEDVDSFGEGSVSSTILTLLDDLSNYGLYLLAKIIMGGVVEFEKTRPKMKKVIRENLPKMLKKHGHSDYQVGVCRQLSELLKDPRNYRQNHSNPKMQSHHDAVMNVLDGLEDMSFQTLSAMHRKLRGTEGALPQLQPSKSGWTRDRLIQRVRKESLEMLSQLDESDALQEPLAKAMAVADLSMRLHYGYQDSFRAKFYRATPKVEALQNEIVKAIWVLHQKAKMPKLKKLQQLLDPVSEVPNKGLRVVIKKMLTEFLFECVDLDAIPDSLLGALAIINKGSRSVHKLFSKQVVDEEVECILNVSAQIKQIVWDHLPNYKVDQHFADAYMGELEESDDGDFVEEDDDDDGELQLHADNLHEAQCRFKDFSEEVESTDYSDRADSNSPSKVNSRNGSDPHFTPPISSNSMSVGILEAELRNGMHLEDLHDFSSGSLVEAVKCDDDKNTDRKSGEGELDIPIPNGNGLSTLLSSILLVDGSVSGKQDPQTNIKVDSDHSDSDLCGKTKSTLEHQNKSRNQYVAVQDVCDQTSVVAYRLIGHVLDGFAQMDGLALNWDDESYLRGDHSSLEDFNVARENWAAAAGDANASIIVRAVQKVIPSFCDRELEKVKNFMSSK